MNNKNRFQNLPMAAKILIPLIAVLLVFLIFLAVLNARIKKTTEEPAVAEDVAQSAVEPATNEPEPAAQNTPAAAEEAVTVDASAPPVVTAEGITVEAMERPTFLATIAPVSAAPEDATAPLIGSVPLTSVAPLVPAYTVEADLSNVSGISDGWETPGFFLDDTVKEVLARQGFAIVEGGGGSEFFDLYETNRYDQLPNFVTVDAMMHTYHLYFMHLMKHTEKEQLFPVLTGLTDAMLTSSKAQLSTLAGTEWEAAAKANTAFFAVGAQLMGGGGEIPAEVADIVNAELAAIERSSAIEDSALLTLLGADVPMEDYSQYTVRGYYEGDEVLEPYFRTMMWYGRMHFPQSSEVADRAALLMNLAMDESFSSWESIYAVTSFFAGASDDCGYYEYRPIIDAAYGEGADIAVLPGNEDGWNKYHALTAAMRPPTINSVVVYDEGTDVDHEEEVKGYRFMGQRFTIDAAIMQNLVYNKVGTAEAPRSMPNALDVPAALGSDAALSILNEIGETNYVNYKENMDKLRSDLASADESLWNASLYAQWLNTLLPILTPKGEGYPAFMQSDAWTRKNLQSFLGSYTELKHDTVLYAKQVMVEMGGAMFDNPDDRGYVEPEPEVFARLAALTNATAEGLSSYGFLKDVDAENLSRLATLATQLQTIAEKELTGELPTDEEFDIIRTFGGQLEHFWEEVYREEAEATGAYLSSREFPAALVTDIATNPGDGVVLELGTGDISEIYVIVPVDGSLRVASGGVFSFYQFHHPLSDRLTDTKWRQMMGLELSGDTYEASDPKSAEGWTSDFQIPKQYYSW